MKLGRFVVSIVAAGALLPLTSVAALAAPPGNDKPDGAVALSLGDTYKEDTSQATTDKTDSRANRFCGAPFTNASVWFSYTPTDDGTFLLDMSKSDYSGGFMVFKSTPTPRHLLACGPTEVALDGTAGTTYLIMAFSDTKKNGGNLVLSLEQGPPPPTISATIDATGTVLPKGKAEISGTFTCTKADFAEVDGQLRQIWHRVKITAFFSKIEPGLCDGHVHDWSRIVTSHNGTYAAGDATVRIDASACGLLDCEDAVVRQHVTLSKGGRDSISHDAFSSGTLRPVAPLTSRQWPTAA